MSLLNNGGSKADMVVISFRERRAGDERWRLNLEYDSALYFPATAERFADLMVHYLDDLAGSHARSGGEPA